MEKQLGPESKLKVEMVDGKLKISVEYDGKQVDATAAVSADVDMFVDGLMDIIPGDSQFEKTMGELLKVALKSAKV